MSLPAEEEKKGLNNRPYWVAVVLLYIINSVLFVLFFRGPRLELKIRICLIGSPLSLLALGAVLGALGALIPYKRLPYKKKFTRAALIGSIIYLVFYSVILGLIGVKRGMAL